MNSGIAAEIYYDPARTLDYDHVLYAYQQGSVLCAYNAKLLEYLAEASGIPASMVYLWGSASGSRYDCYLHYEAHDYYTVTFRTPASANDAAPANPHFIYHAITTCGGVFYDPSYGTVGLTPFDEVCPTYSWSGPGTDAHYPPDPNEPSYTPTQQQGSQPPSLPVQALFVPYVCPH